MDDTQTREFLRRLSAVEYSVEGLSQSVERKGHRLDGLGRRVDDLEVSYGSQMAHITREWRRFDEALATIQQTDDTRADMVDRMFELENQRHELTINELKRLGQSVADLQNRAWEETTGIKNLDQLQAQSRKLSVPPSAGAGEADEDGPRLRKDSWHTAKMIGAITALVVALASLATAISDCAEKVRVDQGLK